MKSKKMDVRTAFVKRNSISLRYLLSFLGVAFIALASAGYTYYEAQHILESNIEQFNLETMSGIRDLVDDRLSEMDATVNRVASYHMTNRVLNLQNPFGTSQMYRLKEYAEYLRNVETQTNPAFTLTVYSPKNSYVFNNGYATPYPAFYDEVLRDDGDAEDSQWFGDLNEAFTMRLRPAREIYISGVPHKVIPYTQTLPVGSRRSLGAICIFIDHDDLFRGLVDAGPFSHCYVLGPDGSVMTSFNRTGPSAAAVSIPESGEGSFTQILDGERMIVAFVKSEWGLTFVSVTPFSIVMSQSRYLHNVFVLAIILCLAICSAAAILFVRKNATPITAVYRMLSEHTMAGGALEARSNLDYIRQSVSRLLEDNVYLQQIMDRQTEEMQVAYLSRLLTGSFETSREMQASAEHAGLRIEDMLYIVVIIRILHYGDLSLPESIAELHVVKAKIRQTLEPAGDHVIVVDTAANQFALVFHFPPDGVNYYRDFIGLIIADLKAIMLEHGIEFKAAAGSPCTRLTDLFHAYREANLTSGSHRSSRETPLYWYEDVKKEPGQIFFYPTNLEQRITAYMRGGEVGELAALLDAVIHENCEKLRISDAMGDLLLSEMRATLLRFAKEVYQDNAELLDALVLKLSEPAALPLPDALERLKGSFMQLCEEAALRSTHHTLALKQKILGYIDANYMDPGMSLSMIASRFSLSESYFSAFFKKQTGENFVGYIAAKRLEKARALLTENRYTVEEIARMVGYMTSHSFRRAFKKNYGTNPATYSRHEG